MLLQLGFLLLKCPKIKDKILQRYELDVEICNIGVENLRTHEPFSAN